MDKVFEFVRSLPLEAQIGAATAAGLLFVLATWAVFSIRSIRALRGSQATMASAMAALQADLKTLQDARAGDRAAIETASSLLHLRLGQLLTLAQEPTEAAFRALLDGELAKALGEWLMHKPELIETRLGEIANARFDSLAASPSDVFLSAVDQRLLDRLPTVLTGTDLVTKIDVQATALVLAALERLGKERSGDTWSSALDAAKRTLLPRLAQTLNATDAAQRVDETAARMCDAAIDQAATEAESALAAQVKGAVSASILEAARRDLQTGGQHDENVQRTARGLVRQALDTAYQLVEEEQEEEEEIDEEELEEEDEDEDADDEADEEDEEETDFEGDDMSDR